MAPAALTLVAFLAFGPGWLDGYAGLVAWTLMVQAALSVSYHLVGGIAGQIHLGHGLFFGLGAYAAALALGAGWPAAAALALAGACGAAAGALVCPLLIPLNGPPFALASLALVLGAKTLAANLEAITGGTAGLVLATSTSLAGPLHQAAMVLAATVWIHRALFDAPAGRALRALAADPVAAAGLGLIPNRLRAQTLITASALAALAGGSYPLALGYVSPQSAFGLETALGPVVAAMIGGVGTRWGPLLGTVVFIGLQEWLWTRGWQASLGLLGLSLVVVGWVLPRGLAGAAEHIATLFSGRTNKAQRTSPPA